MKADPFRTLDAELSVLRAKGLLREPSTVGKLHVMCSNDYLGLGGELAHAAGQGGAGASPLVSGYTDVHDRASESLRGWLGGGSVTLFTSGYAANVGLIQALGTSDAVVLSDALNHASIIDGCRLGRATVEVVRHRDLEHLETTLRRTRAKHVGPVWVVTESYFSMDGDSPDLREVRSLCDRFEAGMVVDEAHALGVYGPEGRGLCAAAGVVPDILVGTLGKSLGLHGAFVVGPALLRTFLWNRARSLVFSTAASPLVLGLVEDRVRRVTEGDDLRRALLLRSERLRSVLCPLAAGLGGSVVGFGPITPLVVGAVVRSVAVARRLEQRGYLVKAMRPPTVPENAARLRFTASLSNSAAVVDAFLDALPTVFDETARSAETSPP